jgi:hypothetical protein
MNNDINGNSLSLESLETRLEMEALNLFGDASGASPLAIEVNSEPCTICTCEF